MLTPREVRRLLDVHGLAANKRLGQNFVVDANTVRKTVRDAAVGHGDLVVEVGPGLGSLTLGLREAGADVVAIEVDAGLVRALSEVVGDDEHVRVVHDDALRIEYADLLGDDGRAPLLVSNLPYNIATPVVLQALESQQFARLHVMVQREVGERWCANVGDQLYSAVSVKIATLAAARLTAAVPRSAFFPVPNVDSVTVALQPKPWRHDVPRRRVVQLVDRGFRQRRKRLRNALAGELPPVAVEAALAVAGLSPAARAEELDLSAWAGLARTMPS